MDGIGLGIAGSPARPDVEPVVAFILVPAIGPARRRQAAARAVPPGRRGEAEGEPQIVHHQGIAVFRAEMIVVDLARPPLAPRQIARFVAPMAPVGILRDRLGQMVEQGTAIVVGGLPGMRRDEAAPIGACTQPIGAGQLDLVAGDRLAIEGEPMDLRLPDRDFDGEIDRVAPERRPIRHRRAQPLRGPRRREADLHGRTGGVGRRQP